MGNQLWNEDDELLQRSHPGCMSGILHALVGHSQVKTILPYKKQHLLRHGKRDRSPRLAIENDPFEVNKLLDDEKNQPHVDQKTKKSSSTNKRSLRASIRALVSEPGHGQKPRVPRLKRTLSIHHLEPSADWGHPIIFLQKNTDINSSKMMNHNHTDQEEEKPKNLIEASMNEELLQEKNASDHKDNDFVDILEMFQVNKELLQNGLQNTDGQQYLNSKARLTKSGSFPAAFSSTGKSIRPAKLEHKQNEIYCFPKSEKLGSNIRGRRLVSSKSGPLVFDGSDHEYNKGSFAHIRRISSLRESTDRYAQLFESNSSKLPKLHMSKSLRLTNENENENENLSRSHASMFFKRILSFPHLERSSSTHSQESQDEKEPGILPVITNRYVGIRYEEGPDYVNSVIERDEIFPRAEYSTYSTEGLQCMDYPEINTFSELRSRFTVEKSNYKKEQEEKTSIEVQPTADFLTESCFQEEVKVKVNAEFHNSEGPEKSDVISTDISSTEILPHSCQNKEPEIFETEKLSVKSHNRIKSCVKDDADFLYVRDILELSGLITDGLNSTWYPSDHPLDPSLFEELEYRYPCEPECFEDGITTLSHHLLLFDLVDEVLFDLFEKSDTYYPKALSSSCHVQLVPTGNHFLDEVWAKISKSLSFKPNRKWDLDLNWVVSQDMGKNDGWMNLQFDSESLALELEEIILDELLGEMFSC